MSEEPAKPNKKPASLSLTEEQAEKALAFLKETVNLTCPRCGHDNFDLSDSFVLLQAIGSGESPLVIGRGVPCILTFCTKCGFAAMHAVATVGLLPANFQPYNSDVYAPKDAEKPHGD